MKGGKWYKIQPKSKAESEQRLAFDRAHNNTHNNRDRDTVVAGISANGTTLSDRILQLTDQYQSARKEMAAGIRATALYDYQAANDNELSFKAGDVIEDIVEIDSRLRRNGEKEWWNGSVNGKQGRFPSSYAQKIVA